MINHLPFETPDEISSNPLILSRIDQAATVVTLILSQLNQPLPGKGTKPRLEDVQQYLLSHVCHAFDNLVIADRLSARDALSFACGESEDDLVFVTMFRDEDSVGNDVLDVEIMLRCNF